MSYFHNLYFLTSVEHTDFLHIRIYIYIYIFRRRRRQRMTWLDGITDLMDVSLSKLWGVGDGQGSLACCSPWGRKETDTTERLN